LVGVGLVSLLAAYSAAPASRGYPSLEHMHVSLASAGGPYG